jgi:N-acetylglucosaminyldiphosphoundecaprenol N-acetyl-beta-D-mannosaminyltransferase
MNIKISDRPRPSATDVSVRLKFLGCPLDVLPPKEILARAHRSIRIGTSLRIEGLNVAKIIQARRDQALMEALNEAEIVHLDGVGVSLGGRLLGYQLPPRRTGCDLMEDLMPEAARQGYRVYFLGATQEVLSETIERVHSTLPDLQIVGAHNGYFTEEDEERIAREIQSKNVDLLFVGISSPKKELFIRRWWALLNVRVSIGVGGSFDVLSGRIARAPSYIQRIGLEWLFRFCQEPRRLAYRYLSTNAAFAMLLLREALSLKTRNGSQG